MEPDEDGERGKLYREAAMEAAWQLIQARHREHMAHNGDSPLLVTRQMVADWVGVPVEQVTSEDGVFTVALDPVSQWCCTVQEADDDDAEQDP